MPVAVPRIGACVRYRRQGETLTMAEHDIDPTLQQLARAITESGQAAARS